MRSPARAKRRIAMSKKRYTSDEMREMEPFAVVVKMTKYGPVKETKKTNDLRAMLLQAADLEEELKRSIADAHAALAERDALQAQLAENDAKWASRVELQKCCTETVQNELNQVRALLDETRLKWSCHEKACKTCPCQASKTDETGRTRHLCDCTRQETVLSHMEKNCSKFANYDEAVEAFMKFCNNERGMPCGDCPYVGEKLSCMARWIMDIEKKGDGNG